MTDIRDALLPSLDERRRAAVDEFARRVHDAESTCAAFLSTLHPEGFPSRQALMKPALESTIALANYYQRNSQYLTDSLKQNVEQLIAKTREVWAQIGVAQRLVGLDAMTRQQRDQAWDRALSLLTQEIPVLGQEITRQMQEALSLPTRESILPEGAVDPT
jgi:hypothetical protein